MTYRQESRLILATSGPKLLRGYQIGAGSSVSDQFGHSLASVEIRDCANHRFAFCLRAGEADRIQKLVFWNINSRLHASRVTPAGLLVQGILMIKGPVYRADLIVLGLSRPTFNGHWAFRNSVALSVSNISKGRRGA